MKCVWYCRTAAVVVVIIVITVTGRCAHCWRGGDGGVIIIGGGCW